MPLLLQVLVAFALLAALFGMAFRICRRFDNYGFVDVVWSYAFGLVAVIYSVVGTGWPTRRVLLAVLVGAWSLRLGSHLLRRLAKHHPESIRDRVLSWCRCVAGISREDERSGSKRSARNKCRNVCLKQQSSCGDTRNTDKLCDLVGASLVELSSCDSPTELEELFHLVCSRKYLKNGQEEEHHVVMGAARDK
jgi:hypothetical protein